MKQDSTVKRIKETLGQLQKAIKDNETAEAVLAKLKTHVKDGDTVSVTFAFQTSGKMASHYMEMGKGLLERILEEEIGRTECLLNEFDCHVKDIEQWYPENMSKD